MYCSGQSIFCCRTSLFFVPLCATVISPSGFSTRVGLQIRPLVLIFNRKPADGENPANLLVYYRYLVIFCGPQGPQVGGVESLI